MYCKVCKSQSYGICQCSYGAVAYYLTKSLRPKVVLGFKSSLYGKIRVWTSGSCFERDVHLLELKTPQGSLTAKFCRGDRTIAGSDRRRVFWDFQNTGVDIKDPNSQGETPWNYGFHNFEEVEILS